jgi:carboxymethylenebutenolidase
MTERVSPFTLEQIGSGTVRFSSKGIFETHKDQMVDPYAATRIPKEAQVEGVQFWPQEKGVLPAIIMLHERWGLTTQIKDMAKRLACEGFVVLAPNLYGRQGGMITANAEVATALMERMDETTVIQDINACCEFLNTNLSEDSLLEHTKRNLHAVVGFGLGGTLALRFACRRKRLRAAVSFYGSIPSPIEELAQTYCPIQYHAAEPDEYVSSESMTQLEEFAKTSEKAITVYKYDKAHHGFCNDTLAEVYNKQAHDQAWESMIDFLKSSLVTK